MKLSRALHHLRLVASIGEYNQHESILFFDKLIDLRQVLRSFVDYFLYCDPTLIHLAKVWLRLQTRPACVGVLEVGLQLCIVYYRRIQARLLQLVFIMS